MWKFGLVNAVTATRFALLFVLVQEIMKHPHVQHPLLECVIWLIMGLTDLLDGPLARRFNVESKFGQYFDAVTDKTIAVTMVPTLLIYRSYPWWAATVLVLLVIIWVWQSWAYLHRTGELPRPRFVGRASHTLWGLTIFPFLMDLGSMDFLALAMLLAPISMSYISVADYIAAYGWSWKIPMSLPKAYKKA